jgi:uncharacterized protein (TIGR03067 family)
MNLLTAFALASFVAAPEPKAEPAQDVKQVFQGEWKIVEYTKSGSAEKKEELADAKIVVKGDRMAIHFGGKDREATFTVDPKADPPAIDLKPQKVGKEVIIKGIYKLEKDRITICTGVEGTDRPKEFKSVNDSRTELVVLERVKK